MLGYADTNLKRRCHRGMVGGCKESDREGSRRAGWRELASEWRESAVCRRLAANSAATHVLRSSPRLNTLRHHPLAHPPSLLRTARQLHYKRWTIDPI